MYVFTGVQAAPGAQRIPVRMHITQDMPMHADALAYAQEDDGGTCNFDAPMLDYRASGIPLGEAKQAIADAGLRCYEHRMYGEKALVICGCQHGQGNRRTVMAEAFSRALKAQGYVCGMYYQMD